MRTRSSITPLAVLILVSGALVAHAMVFNFINDDAFISFRYADNLVRHGELVFNVGERVEGYTNFLWTMMMAGVMALGLDPVPWSKGLGVVLAVLTLWVIARFTSRRNEGLTLWDAVAPALLAAAPAYACWSTGGLETQLFTFTATMGWTGYLTERREGRTRSTSGIWFALCAMTRPEGMLLFGLTGLHRIGMLIGEARSGGRFMPTVGDWVWGAGFALVFVPFYAWRWVYYGWPFPNTYYVKTGASGFWGPGWNYFWSWVETHHLWLLPLIVAFKRLAPPPGQRALMALGGLYTLGVGLHVVRVGGDFMALHRFFVPLMPLLAVMAAEGIRGGTEALLASGVSRLRLSLGAGALSLMVLYGVGVTDKNALKVGSEGGVDSIGWLNMFAGQCTAIGKHLATIAPPEASLATTAAGIIPYYSRLYTLDVLGLNDEWIAHNVEPRGKRPGHTKSAPLSYILEKQVDYLIYHPTIAKRPPGQGAGQKRAWKQRGYTWQTEKVPGLTPPWWGFWQKSR
ncbi:MAG: hypothetical protein ACE366_23680 [Bradymonadia bacterium]